MDNLTGVDLCPCLFGVELKQSQAEFEATQSGVSLTLDPQITAGPRLLTSHVQTSGCIGIPSRFDKF
jgi:hypothetical protein